MADHAGADGLRVHRDVAAQPDELAALRQWAVDALTGHLPGIGADCLTDVLSVLDELASNALRHAAAPVRVALATELTEGGLVRIEVSDGSREPARLRSAARDGGRGLLLVTALSLRWDQQQHDAGKTVWADLPLTVASPAPGVVPDVGV